MINFPDNPTTNQLYTNGAATYQYDGVKWVPRITGYLPTSGGTVNGDLVVNGATTVAGLLRVNNSLSVNMNIPADNVGYNVYSSNIFMSSGTLALNIYYGNTAPAGWKHLTNQPGAFIYVNPSSGELTFASTPAGTVGAVAPMMTTMVINQNGTITATKDISAVAMYLSYSGDTGGGNTTTAGFGARRWRFMQNAGDQNEAGSIDYRGYDGNCLSIVGAGTSDGGRLVKLYDQLYIRDKFRVDGRSGYIWTNGDAQFDGRFTHMGPGGSSNLAVYDDGNSHIESSIQLWINSNGHNTDIGGSLNVRGYSVHSDLRSNGNVYVPNGYGYFGQYVEAGSDIKTHQSFYTQSKGDAGANTDWGFFSGRKWRFAQYPGDEGNAGSFDYRQSDGGVLSIIGAGGNPRRVKIWDQLEVNNGLYVYGVSQFYQQLNCNNDFVVRSTSGNGQYLQIYNDGNPHLYTNSTFWVDTYTIFRNRALFDGGSDNVEVRAGGGSHARTIYNSWGMRAWSVGALNNGNFQIADESAATFRFQITTGGESFINCHLAPWINGQFNLGYSQSAWQYVYAYAFPTISDASEKTDIAPHPVALPYVEALEPKTFRWKDMSNKRLNHGFIAQDVREVFGEDFGGWLGGAKQAIAYSDLTAVLWQGVRELSATVKRLSAELEMLKAGK